MDSITSANGVKCIRYKNTDKWIPEDNITRLSGLYNAHPDLPDYVTMDSVCVKNSFNVNDPFETFLCGYLCEGNRNKKQFEQLSSAQSQLINTLAEIKVLNLKLENAENQYQQLAQEYAMYRNSVTESDWQRAINERDARIIDLECTLKNAEDKVNNYLKTKQNEYNEELLNKSNEIAKLKTTLQDEDIKKRDEIAKLKTTHLDESIKSKQQHFNQISQKDDEILKLKTELENVQEELNKAKQEASYNLKIVNNESINKEIQLADNLHKFKRVTWALLEKILISYDNTLLYIDDVKEIIKKCVQFVSTFYNNSDKSNIGNVVPPNIKECKDSIKKFEEKYLGDIKEEIDQVKRAYDWDLLPSKRLNDINLDSDQSEMTTTI